ncbi:MAG TPA: hypothetical protein VGH09_05350 [Solirubrobacteraceae bacterium]|jgi:hypothetical protein
MARPAIRWYKQAKGVVSAVSPGSPVRLWVEGWTDPDTNVEVFQIAEHAIARALRKLFRSPGAYVTNLSIDSNAAVPSGKGALSVEWRARQALQKSIRASRYVGREPHGGASGPLDVFADADVRNASKGPSGGMHVDLGPLGAAIGIPIPARLDVETGQRTASMESTVTAGVDPEVELRVLTPDAPELALETYIEEVAEVFEISAGELAQAFWEVNAQWLKDPVAIDYGTEAGVHLEAGESFTTAVRLYAGNPGSTLLAFAAVERTADELRPVAISELIGLTVDEHGLIYRDF